MRRIQMHEEYTNIMGMSPLARRGGKAREEAEVGRQQGEKEFSRRAVL